MSTQHGLRAVAFIEAAKGVLALLLGAGALALLHTHARDMAASNALSGGVVGRFLGLALALDARWLVSGVLAYAGLRFVEAYGLWRRHVWAEWLAVVSGSIYLPFEAWQLGTHFSWPMLGALGVNLAVVGYVAQGRLAGVVSDILRPRLDAYRLCAEIRRQPRFADLRFVLHTGSYTSPADEKLAYRFGVDAFLREPAKAADLAAALRGPSRARPASNGEGAAEAETLDVLHQYSDALVRKLEQKYVELEETAAKLRTANHDLVERTQQLEATKAELQRLNLDLENRVRERTAQLQAANRELEKFSDAVAHDLHSPIRTIEGYAAILSSECIEQLTEDCREYVRKLPAMAKRVSEIADDLMRLSNVNRMLLQRTPTDLSSIAHEIVAQLRRQSPGRKVDVRIAPGVMVNCDGPLLTIALENLLGNAWKFTTQQPEPVIEVGCIPADQPVIYVRDNGAGFDITLAPQLFTAFNRLHSHTEFADTGIGLATVKRIIDRHGGRIWAEAAVGRGATFSFTLA